MLPVILSGGSGTRLWPVSNEFIPKQFGQIFSEPLIQSTINRLKPYEKPMFLTVNSLKSHTQDIIVKNNFSERNQAIYEPCAKNTGPAIALLCHVLNQRQKRAEVVGVFPSDHLVEDEPRFHETIKLAIECAHKDKIVTLGIKPHYPATGYGYIQADKEKVFLSAEKMRAYAVSRFHEKPDLEKAKSYLSEGSYFWNAGMFLFKTETLIKAFKKYQPQLWKQISEIKFDFSNLVEVYENLEAISFDHSIMEHIDNNVCIPCDPKWSDVGCWDEVARLSQEDDLVINSKDIVISDNKNTNFVYSTGKKTVGLVGVEDLIIVNTPDSLLVTKRGETQNVKKIVNQIKENFHSEDQAIEYRPWGHFETLSEDENYKLKRITVNSGKRLSYQSHFYRSELWTILSGEATVTLDGELHEKKAGECIFIPQGAKHRVENKSSESLVFLELQTGVSFKENDIVRYEDDYGRI